MPTVAAPSILFEELATLFALGPNPQEVLDFRPSDAAIQRASKLLDLSRQDRLDDDLRHELDRYEQAELLMRLVGQRHFL